MPNLARTHQIGHSAYGVLNRYRAVDPMLIIKIDVIDAEPLKRSITSASNILRRAIKKTIRPRLVSHKSKLRGKDHALAPALQRLAHLDFRYSVNIRGIEERDPQIHSAMDQ